MRVIAGTAKGRRLLGPKGSHTRPMTGRAREALFSSLEGRIRGARVLDLFAGSGSLGIEALSRGATSAVFVERERSALAALRANLKAVGLPGEVAAQDVGGYLESARPGGFDLVFVDPPFAEPSGEVEQLLEALRSHLAPGATVVVHRRAGEQALVGCLGLRLEDQRRYGDTALWRFSTTNVKEEP